MLINYFKINMVIILIFSNLFLMSANSWFSMWMWLEINLISFIILMFNKLNLNSIESALIYFIIQSIASIIILFSILFFFFNNYMMYMIFLSLLLKLGIFPFHIWLLMIILNLKWLNIFILLTWQKLGPMIMLMNLNFKINFFFMFLLFSLIISMLMGMNFISLKKILLFSSINQLSWILLSLMIMNKIFKIYFLIYMFMNMMIIYYLKINKILYIYQMYNFKFKLYFFLNSLMMLMFLNLLGLPPLMGFYPKLIMIFKINNIYMYLLIFISIFNSFYYLRIFYSIFMINNLKLMNFNFYNNNLMFINIFILFSIFLMPLLMI